MTLPCILELWPLYDFTFLIYVLHSMAHSLRDHLDSQCLICVEVLPNQSPMSCTSQLKA